MFRLVRWARSVVKEQHLRIAWGGGSLTGACVCHRCLKRLVREAEIEGVEKLTYLHRKVNKPIYIGIKEAVYAPAII